MKLENKTYEKNLCHGQRITSGYTQMIENAP